MFFMYFISVNTRNINLEFSTHYMTNTQVTKHTNTQVTLHTTQCVHACIIRSRRNGLGKTEDQITTLSANNTATQAAILQYYIPHTYSTAHEHHSKLMHVNVKNIHKNIRSMYRLKTHIRKTQSLSEMER